MNEKRRGEDFNEIVSIIKELFEKYNVVSMELHESKYKYSYKEKPFVYPEVQYDGAILTLKFNW